MKGHGWLKLEKENLLREENDLAQFEANRSFRASVPAGSAISTSQIYGNLFFKGEHYLDFQSGSFPYIGYYGNVLDLSNPILTAETFRLRRLVENTELAPAQPGQIAFALGSIGASGQSTVSPSIIYSLVDINLKRIGNVFGHPTGRRAFFNETAVTPTGTGVLFSSGCLDYATGSGDVTRNASPISGSNTGEEGHHIYYVRIARTGNESNSEYFFQRRPYYVGAFEAGSGEADNFSAADLLTARWPGEINTRSSLIIGSNNLGLPSESTSPTPSQVPYVMNYPTQTARTSGLTSLISGMVFDGLPAGSGSIGDRRSGRVWWCTVDPLAANNVNATTSRSVWSWRRFSRENFYRQDASGSLGNNTQPNGPLTSFPSLGSSTQFRDFRAGRNGFLYLAADGDDDAGTGNNTGALIQIDASSGSVINVAGNSAAGIYTVGGMLQNNAIAVAIDKSGQHTLAANMDRVWVLHRNGLSYADFFSTTGEISGSGFLTVGSGTSDFNVIDGGSIRGLAGFTPRGTGGFLNGHGSLLDVDGQGNVYWVSTNNASRNYSNSTHRLNKLDGSTFTHSFYSLNSTGEVGSFGQLNMGVTTGVSGTVNCLTVHRRDPGDPDNDDIWLSTGAGTNNPSSKIIAQIPTGSWVSGNNDPGIGYYGNTVSNTATSIPWYLNGVSPDGSIWISSDSSNFMAILESLGRVVSGSGVGDSLSVSSLSGSLFTQTLSDSAGRFTASMKGKKVLITSAQPENTGSHVVSEVLDRNNVVIINSGVSETSSFIWTFSGVDFDSTGTVGSTPAGWTNSEAPDLGGAYNMFIDDSGVGFAFHPRDGASTDWHMLIHHMPITWQWDSAGSRWYRSRVPTVLDAATRTSHASTQHLTNGVEIAFSGTANTNTEFVSNEFYTFPVSIGVIKDATQEITWGYDLYYQKTDLIEPSDLGESYVDKACAAPTARGGAIAAGNLTNVLTDNPFVLSTSASIQLASYQKRLLLDGNNNTQNISIAGTWASNVTTAPSGSGATLAIDLGSDTVASRLIFGWGPFSSTAAGANNVQFDLYSSTAAAGSGSWTLRATYQSRNDNPEWTIVPDSFRDETGGNGSLSTRACEMHIDLELLDGSGSFGSNTSQRYWKLVGKQHDGGTSSTQVPQTVTSVMALNAGGLPIGIPASKYLATAHDTNYMANYVLRGVFVLGSGSAQLSAGPAINQVQLSAGSFPGETTQNDYIRRLDNSTGRIITEYRISNVDSSSVLTVTEPVKLGFSGADWIIVRNADIRPRDDEGNSEDQAVFPPSGGAGAGQVYICPITGHIHYNDRDITRNRIFRVERYIKVKREL